MTRPRFTLRTLLIAVLVCAVGICVFKYSQLPPHEARKVQLGMSRQKIQDELGNPRSIRLSEGNEWWKYSYSWGELFILFGQNSGNCTYAEYWVPGAMHSLQRNGEYSTQP